jgi:hypothetical protein
MEMIFLAAKKFSRKKTPFQQYNITNAKAEQSIGIHSRNGIHFHVLLRVRSLSDAASAAAK